MSTIQEKAPQPGGAKGVKSLGCDVDVSAHSFAEPASFHTPEFVRRRLSQTRHTVDEPDRPQSLAGALSALQKRKLAARKS
jgi:hypothetical protein